MIDLHSRAHNFENSTQCASYHENILHSVQHTAETNIFSLSKSTFYISNLFFHDRFVVRTEILFLDALAIKIHS